MTRRRRALAVVIAAAALLSGGAVSEGIELASDWACAGAGDPLDVGVCVSDPFPERLPEI